MQPIRKQEQEFHDKLIGTKINDGRNELDRKIRIEAEKLTTKSLPAFKKKIKVDKLLEAFKTATKEYDSYMDQRHLKEKQLERKKDQACDNLSDHLKAQEKIYGWNRSVCREDSVAEYESIIREACNQEAMTHIKQTDLGTKYQSMGIVKEQSLIALYKGDSLDVAVKNINGIMKQVGVVYFNPKFLQIANK